MIYVSVGIVGKKNKIWPM